VAHLSQFARLETPGANVDAAIALINPGAVDTNGTIFLLGSTVTGNVPNPGPPRAGMGVAANVGLSVAKSGRTTGLTCSSVGAIAISTRVQYQAGCGTGTMFTVTYQNQISVSGGTFSAQGDSGSLIVSQGSADPVALLYGGSDTDSVGNPIQDVLAAMADPVGTNRFLSEAASAHQVIACTLPGFSAARTTAQSSLTLETQALAPAVASRDIHANELLANPYVRAVGAGRSIDYQGEPAVLLVVDPSQRPTKLPAMLEGIRTRIVPGGTEAPRGVLDVSAERAAGSERRNIFSEQSHRGASDTGESRSCGARGRVDEETRGAGFWDHIKCGCAGRGGTDDFPDSRRCARPDSAGDRWSANTGSRIQSLPSRFWRCAEAARVLDAFDKKNAARAATIVRA